MVLFMDAIILAVRSLKISICTNPAFTSREYSPTQKFLGGNYLKSKHPFFLGDGRNALNRPQLSLLD